MPPQAGAGRSPLGEPPPALEVVEYHEVAAVGGDDLPIAAAQRATGPPAVLHQPGLPDRIDLVPGHGERAPLGAGADRGPARGGETARRVHGSRSRGRPFRAPSNGASSARRSGTRESSSTVTTRRAASGPAAARAWATASRRRALRAAATSSSSGRWSDTG